MRKTFVVLFFLLLTVIFFMDAMARDYSIPSSKVTFEIKPDGRVMVHEKIEYILHGCFHELYLSKPKELMIYNASGYCENAECSFRVEEPWASETGGAFPVRGSPHPLIQRWCTFLLSALGNGVE